MIDFATYYYTQRKLGKEEIDELFDVLTEGKSEAYFQKTSEDEPKGKVVGKAYGGLTGVDQYIINRGI